MTEKVKSCTDQCIHCIYIGDGDFICNIRKEDVTIAGWNPGECICPNKKEVRK